MVIKTKKSHRLLDPTIYVTIPDINLPSDQQYLESIRRDSVILTAQINKVYVEAKSLIQRLNFYESIQKKIM